MLLAPVEGQEVWAAGVTYAASRARPQRGVQGGHDFYDQVYDAERPELFFKAAPGRVRGPGGLIGVREDSGWDVPEPELALVISAAGEILGYTIGNDVSSRSIEGENPLYLPQAKVYRGSCALGPCIVPVDEAPPAEEMEITLTISRDGEAVFTGSTQVALLKRGLPELVVMAVPRAGLPGRRGAADGYVGDSGGRVHAAGRRRGADRDHRPGRTGEHGGGRMKAHRLAGAERDDRRGAAGARRSRARAS